MSGSQQKDLLPFTGSKSSTSPQFSDRERAMISLYEFLRDEWEKRIDDIERLGDSVSQGEIEQADACSQTLGAMERQLPESYRFPGEMEWVYERGTVAAALDRLLMRDGARHIGRSFCVSFPSRPPPKPQT